MKACLISIFLLTLSSAWSQESKSISASDIGWNYTLTGIGGIPLGKIFIIEGKAVSDPERDSPKDGGSRKRVLLITSVDGKPLEKAVEACLLLNEALPSGIIFRLRVIEDARYELAFTPNPSSDASVKDEGRQRLVTFLRLIEQLSPKNPKLSER